MSFGNVASQTKTQTLNNLIRLHGFWFYPPRTIKQMAREGRIPAHPFGSGARKRWYFLISELAEHLRGQVNSAHGEAGRDKTQRRVI